MATIKKACKGVSYPKSSSVSGRLGSVSKAKMGKLVPSSSSVSKRMGTVKKAEKGSSLGMKSVKAGFDKNPGVTRADIIVAAKGQAKKGMKVKKAQMGSSVNPKFKMDMDKFKMRKQMDTVKIPYTKDTSGRSTGKVDDIMLRRSSKKSMKTGGKMKKCAYGCK